jgi:uncharacterized delta-60 repeat protein
MLRVIRSPLSLLFPVLLLSACQSGGSEPVPTLPDTSFQLDTTFNTTGIRTTSLSLGSDTALAVIIQPDGRIVTAGSTFTTLNNSDIALVRYNTDGTLDTTFNAAGAQPGVVTTDIDGGNDTAYGVVLQGDGKIVVAGSSLNTTSNKLEVVVARYNTDGSLDSSFNNSGTLPGTVTTAVTAQDNFARSVALHGDGRIVVAGQADNGNDQDIAVVRYNSDGSLDTGFNGTGITVIEVMAVYSAADAMNDIANAVRVQTDDKVVVIGANRNAVVLRFNNDGTLDTGFGDASTGITLLNGFSQGNALLIQPDNMLLVGGATTGSISDMAVARLDTAGALDAGFGTAGVVVVGFLQGRNETVTSLARQTDGKIVAAGGAASEIGYDFALIRLNTNGTLDTDTDADPLVTFGLGGKVSTPIGYSNDAISAIAIQGTGEIVAAGGSWLNNRWIMALARYLP